MEKFPKFTKNKRGTFVYFFWHWLSFNLVAINIRQWKFRHLFHDIEKPWLKLILRDYNKLQKFHRRHNAHHLEYKHPEKRNWVDMLIDWESSKYTKEECPRGGLEQVNYLFDNKEITYNEYRKLITTGLQIGLR